LGKPDLDFSSGIIFGSDYLFSTPLGCRVYRVNNPNTLCLCLSHSFETKEACKAILTFAESTLLKALLKSRREVEKD
jgi:hypothetical protein